MIRFRWPGCFAVAGFLTVGLACLTTAQVHRALTRAPAPVLMAAQPISQPVQVVAVPRAAQAAVVAAAPAPDASYYDGLRRRMHWVETRLGGASMKTPDLDSRVLLAKAAADHARLADVGLSFRDVYGIINAETSWIPRAGASRDGTPNLGIAQFEPATAKALGIVNPNDPVEAVHAAALHMRDAALWSADRLAGLKLNAVDRAEKLRDGVSIYYNLSTRGRAAWNGRNTDRLPLETQRHIENARTGAQEAAWLDAQIEAARYGAGASRPLAAAAPPPRGL